jgi:hypothetical protein
MKKMFILVAAICVATISAIAAPPFTPVSEKAKAAFTSTFKDAANVQWSNYEGLHQVSFEVNNVPVKAWFTEEGQLEAVLRIVDVNRLSFLVAQAVQTLEKEGSINTIAEVNQFGDLFYLVKLETDKHHITYKVSTSGEVSRLTKKKI